MSMSMDSDLVWTPSRSLIELQESFDSLLVVASKALLSDELIGFFVCDSDGRVALLPQVEPFANNLQKLDINVGENFDLSNDLNNPIHEAIRSRNSQTDPSTSILKCKDQITLIAVPVFGLRGSLRAVLVGFCNRGETSQKIKLVLQLSAEAFRAHYALVSSRDELSRLVSEQQAIIDNISDGLIVLDKSHIVRFMNAPAGRILRQIPKDAIGKKLEDLLEYEPTIINIFDTGKGFVDRQTIRETKNRKVSLIDTAIPIKDHLGNVQSVVNTFREVKSMHRIAHSIAGNQARYTFDSLVGDTPSFIKSLEMAKRAAKGDATLLLSGESGTGKEVFVQAIHNESTRANGPFVAINCAALPRELIESELFGYAPGSFTGAIKNGRPGKFELASGGTIFLDEISELPFDVQAKLLRVLQERQVVRVGETRSIDIDVRIISASNKDLREMVQANRFREDLYYRINVIEIEIPSLRERREDIPLLAHTFLRKYADSLRKDVFRIEEDAMQQLMAFDWPGNVRQLENTIERAVHLSEEKSIKYFDLARIKNNEINLKNGPKSDVQTLAFYEKKALMSALAAFSYNITQTAEALGIARPTLYAKIKKHGLALERSISDASTSHPHLNETDV